MVSSGAEARRAQRYILRLRRLAAATIDGLGALCFPASCLLCERALARPLQGPLCEPCLVALPTIESPYCSRCGLPFEQGVAPGLCGPCRGSRRRFRSARAAAPYQDGVRECLHALKYGGRQRLASLLAVPACDRWFRTGELGTVAAVVPVPLSRKRRRQRGFNQAGLVARAVARHKKLDYFPALRKTKDTPPQAGLNASDRRSNAMGAYGATLPPRLIGRDVLLVDDVFTTGATVEAASRALLRAGVRAVDVFTLARVP